jgi:hypothetical protein
LAFCGVVNNQLLNITPEHVTPKPKINLLIYARDAGKKSCGDQAFFLAFSQSEKRFPDGKHSGDTHALQDVNHIYCVPPIQYPLLIKL